MPSNRDLRELQENEAVQDAFGKLISGKSGYRTVIVKDKPPITCKECSKILEGDEKFCPECGAKTASE